MQVMRLFSAMSGNHQESWDQVRRYFFIQIQGKKGYKNSMSNHCNISEGKIKIAYIKIRCIAQLENAEFTGLISVLETKLVQHITGIFNIS